MTSAQFPQANDPTTAIRADMDALPILEQTVLPFASQNTGKMHWPLFERAALPAC